MLLLCGLALADDLPVVLALTSGREPRMLGQGRIESHEPRSAAVFAAQGKEGPFQGVAAPTAPKPLPDATDATRSVATGAFAGCQVTRGAGVTNVECRDSKVFHRTFPAVDEAGRATLAMGIREMVAENLVEERADTLTFGARTVPALRFVTDGPQRPGLVLTAWFDRPGATDQVTAMCPAEADSICIGLLAGFVDGVPAELK